MKKYYIFGGLAVIFAALACTKEVQEQNTVDNNPQKVHMTFGGTLETKSHIENGGTSLYWSEGDKVAIYDGTAIETFTAKGKDAQSLFFDGEAYQIDGYYYGKAPFRSSDSFSGTTYTTSLPTAQTAVEGTFDPAAALAVGKAKADETLVFHNAVAFAKYKLGNMTATYTAGTTIYYQGQLITFDQTTEIDEEIVSVTLSNSSVYMSGDMTVDANSTAPIATVLGTNGDKSVTLIPPTGETVFKDGTDAPWYVLTFAPGAMTQFRLSLLAKSGVVFYKEISSLNVSRGKILNLGTFNLSDTKYTQGLTLDGFACGGHYCFTDGTNSATTALEKSGSVENMTLYIYTANDSDSQHAGDTGYETVPIADLVVIPVYTNPTTNEVIRPTSVNPTTSTGSNRVTTVSGLSVTYSDGTVTNDFTPYTSSGNGHSGYLGLSDTIMNKGYYPMSAIVFYWGRGPQDTGGDKSVCYLYFDSDGFLNRTSTLGQAVDFTGIYPID